ncbi:MAG TPA: GAF domain-containing protein, partial [Candidatus Marinimicrobia bacterium]|nr:GAF domain-containing protein [Candidatus Neomarinimicrobiota bacterium]
EKLKTSIYRISEAAQSSENLDELFQVIHNIIGDLMPTKNFYIALYDDKKELLSFPYFVDEYDEPPPTPKKLRKGLSEYVLRTGNPLLASSEMIKEFVDKKEIKVIGTIPIVWLGMPLKTKDKTIGLIATQSYTKSAKLTDEHKSILKFVSAQIAMAIQYKQAEEENRILARFPADNPNPIMRVRSDTTILYANEPSITLLDNWQTRVGQLLPDNWRQTIQDVLNAGSSKNLEIEIKNQIFSFVVTPMSDSDIVYLYALDVTGRKRAEENLREINQEVVRTNARLVTTMRELEETRDELKSALDTAEESDKLKGEFLANTSHELRTPLNSIIGFLQLIKDGMCDSPEEEREFLTNALMSSNHLLKLINDVLDIAKIEAGKFEVYLQPISLSNLFDEVYLLTSVQATKNKINLEFLFEEKEEIFIYADLDKAKQILLNLIGNSLKFTPKGGIHVSGKAIHKEGVAMIQINDTGIGIPLDKQKRIFEKFNQADGSSSRKYGGTGLGLSITKNLVKLMGGTIELPSPGVNMGTVVSFTLPLSKETTRTESNIQMTVEAF